MLADLPLDRGDVDALAAQRATFDLSLLSAGDWAGYVVDRRGHVATSDATLKPVQEIPHTQPGSKQPQPFLLGATTDKTVHVAWVWEDLSPTQRLQLGLSEEDLSPLIQIAWQLPPDQSLLAAQAVALARWHDDHRFCSRCGHRVHSIEAGWASQCPNCGVTEYPRTDPVVIVRVTDSQDRLLLAHNTAWPERRMSLPAGYVEAGESPRRAVHRELFEELAIRVGDPTYLGSQYWPGPRSLMLAFGAQLNGTDQIHPDGVEIDRARFFTRRELISAVDAKQLLLPRGSSIAAAVIEDWLG